MGVQDSGPMGRIFIRVGCEEIDLTGSDDEIISTLGKILKTDTWQSSLSKIRKARDAAIDATTKSALDAKIPEGVLIRTPSRLMRYRQDGGCHTCIHSLS